jgi:ribosomal protein L18
VDAAPHPIIQLIDEGKDGDLLAAKAVDRKTILGVPALDATGSAAKMLGN